MSIPCRIVLNLKTEYNPIDTFLVPFLERCLALDPLLRRDQPCLNPNDESDRLLCALTAYPSLAPNHPQLPLTAGVRKTSSLRSKNTRDCLAHHLYTLHPYLFIPQRLNRLYTDGLNRGDNAEQKSTRDGESHAYFDDA